MTAKGALSDIGGFPDRFSYYWLILREKSIKRCPRASLSTCSIRRAVTAGPIPQPLSS
jgi:hypothetical protein